jgi:hypothetical protein
MDGVVDLGPAKWLRFAWCLRQDTLYKFRSFRGESRKWVLDIIKNSRIYLPHSPAFAAELLRDRYILILVFRALSPEIN